MCLSLNHRPVWLDQLADEVLEPREVPSELDLAILACNTNLARCWALLEEMGYERP